MASFLDTTSTFDSPGAFCASSSARWQPIQTSSGPRMSRWRYGCIRMKFGTTSIATTSKYAVQRPATSASVAVTDLVMVWVAIAALRRVFMATSAQKKEWQQEIYNKNTVFVLETHKLAG